MAKFKSKKGKIIEVKTLYATNILRNNPNFAEIKAKEPKVDKTTVEEEKAQEVANKPL